MRTRPCIAAGLVGFTLIELLTVIAIIAILMGLLFPVLAYIRNQARVAQCKNDLKQIETALKGYYADYGKYPIPAGTSGASDLVAGDTAAGAKTINSTIFNTLRAIPEEPNTNHKLNPRRVVFLQTTSVADPEHPRGGFLDRTGGRSAAEKGCFFDPWGKQYNVIIDTNADERLDAGQCYLDIANDDKPRNSVGAFSLGKDNKLGDKGDRRLRNGTNSSDDIVSWR